MDTILICPGERPAVAFLAQFAPLANIPMLGESLLGHWMESLAERGVTKALVLATDRPEQVREALGGGARWGIQLEVINELQELRPEEARQKYGGAAITAGQPSGAEAILLDHLPRFPDQPLFTGYSRWFTALLAWLNDAPKSNRIGLRELQPGVWVGRRAHIAPSAELRSPCWIGENARVAAHAVIGPRAILEDRVIVESAAEIVDSTIGPDTFVGALTKVQESFAWGSTLINWRTGSCAQVPDPFLMCPLVSSHPFHGRHATPRWTETCRAALSKPFGLITGHLKAR